MLNRFVTIFAYFWVFTLSTCYFTGECLSSDGRHVFEGESINFGCSECTCAWGELHCSPRPCHTPAGCRRRPASITVDLCCGELICDEGEFSPLTFF